MNKVRTELGYDPRHWTSKDGHLHISVPTKEPAGWFRADFDGEIRYVSYQGCYMIRRQTGGKRPTFTVYRGAEELPLAFYSRLIDAKARAVKNARGEDTVNVA